MELIKFIFSSFWIFCGTVILLIYIGSFLVGIAAALRGGGINITTTSNETEADRALKGVK